MGFNGIFYHEMIHEHLIADNSGNVIDEYLILH